MKKLKLFAKMMEFAANHEVGIRAGAIIGSTLAAVYFAAKDSPKIMAKLDELDAAGATNLEKAKEIAPIAARTLVATGISVGVTLGSAKKVSELVATVSTLSSAYSMAKTANSEFIEKAKEIVGEDKVQEIKRAVVNEKYPESNGGTPVPTVINTGHGDDLIYCEFSKDWMLSDVNYIRNVFLNVKRRVLGGYNVHWNEVAWELGIPTRKSTDHWLWTDEMLYHMGDDELVRFDSGIRDDNKVYTILELTLEPEYSRKG